MFSDILVMKRRLEAHIVIDGFWAPKVILSKESTHDQKMHRHI